MLVAKALIKATPCLGAWEHQEEVGLSSGNEVLLKKTKKSRILRRVGQGRGLSLTVLYRQRSAKNPMHPSIANWKRHPAH